MRSRKISSALFFGIYLTAPAIAAERESVALSIAAVGDIMLGSTWPEPYLPPRDGEGLLDEAAPFLSQADIAIGNLEGPLIDEGSPEPCRPNEVDCHRFRVPTQYAKLLKDAGFDIMSLANNHALDFGFSGRTSSERTLEALGIAFLGAPGQVARIEISGRQLAFIAFAAYDGSNDMRDLAGTRDLVSKASQESDIVIVSFHGGAEGLSRQRVPRGTEFSVEGDHGDVRAFSHAAVDSGADLVIGHGPHVLRGMEVYRGRLIAYSLGNFATYGGFALRGALGLTMILRADLAGDGRFVGGKIIALKQIPPGGPRRDKKRAAIQRVRRLSRKDFGRSAPIVSSDGGLAPPRKPQRF